MRSASCGLPVFFYVKNHSLVLDVLILAETVRVVLFGEGAQ